MVVLRPPLSRGKRRRAQGSLELHAPISLIVFPANAGIQGPPSSGWRPKGHQTTTASAARRVLVFKRTRALYWRKARCAEVRSVAAAPSWLLGPRFPTRSVGRRTPGPRGHRALDGGQKDIDQPRPPHDGWCWRFKRAGASFRSIVHCAGVRSVAAAPSWLLGPRFPTPTFSRRTPGPRGNRALDGGQKDIDPPRPPQHGGCWLFKSAWASCRRKAHCAEVRSVAAAPPRFLGPRFRGGNERGENLRIAPMESSLR